MIIREQGNDSLCISFIFVCARNMQRSWRGGAHCNCWYWVKVVQMLLKYCSARNVIRCLGILWATTSESPLSLPNFYPPEMPVLGWKIPVWDRSLGREDFEREWTPAGLNTIEYTSRAAVFCWGIDLCHLESSCNSETSPDTTWRIGNWTKHHNPPPTILIQISVTIGRLTKL